LIDEWIADRGLPSNQEAAAEESLAALNAAAVRVEGLVLQAEPLVARFRSLALRERRVSEQERRTAIEREQLNTSAESLRGLESDLEARGVELGRRERTLAQEATQNAEAVDGLRREQERLEELGLLLGPESADVGQGPRHRLRRAWHRRPRLAGAKAQVCDLLFLPTSQGYALLRQEGLALRRGARLTLAPEGPSFVVSKVAPWPFDGRWCAYLQQES
jgi:hypothetical protein